MTLTEELIEEARRRHDDDGVSWQKLADEYGVTRRTLCKYVNGELALPIVVRPDWMHDAACATEDPEYFEYEPGVDEEIEDAMARYELAKEVCSACPVKRECAQVADSSDRMWTTRGGLMPLALRRRTDND